jgi:hypothetical protein
VLGHVHELFLIPVGCLTAALLTYTITSNRVALSYDVVSGQSAESAPGIFSRVWPWLFAFSIPVLMAGLIVRELLYDFVLYGAALATLAVFAAAPSVDALFFREARWLRDRGEGIKGAVASGGRFALLVGLVGLLCVAWRINPFAVGGGSLGSQVVNAFLEVSLTLLVAYGAWRFARIASDRKIAEEDAALAAQGIDPSGPEVGGGAI